MSVIAGSTTDAIRCENRLIKFLLQLLVLAMLQFVYVVYVAVYAFLLRRARAVVGEIPCQICRSEILGIDVTSTTRESLKESKEQLASPEVLQFQKFQIVFAKHHTFGWKWTELLHGHPATIGRNACFLLFINRTWKLETRNPQITMGCLLPGRR